MSAPQPAGIVRLNDTQLAAIRRILHEQFGESARIILFGSRISPERRGGDVDLCVETDHGVSLLEQARIVMRLQDALGLDVDLIVKTPAYDPGPIYRIAQLTGIRL